MQKTVCNVLVENFHFETKYYGTARQSEWFINVTHVACSLCIYLSGRVRRTNQQNRHIKLQKLMKMNNLIFKSGNIPRGAQGCGTAASAVVIFKLSYLATLDYLLLLITPPTSLPFACDASKRFCKWLKSVVAAKAPNSHSKDY